MIVKVLQSILFVMAGAEPMLKFAEAAKKPVAMAHPDAKKVSAKVALAMALKRYPRIIANLAD